MDWCSRLDQQYTSKHAQKIDQEVGVLINDYDFVLAVKDKREKRVTSSKHFQHTRQKMENFVAKSGDEIEMLVKSCELEIKEMWSTWHRQFMPDLWSIAKCYFIFLLYIYIQSSQGDGCLLYLQTQPSANFSLYMSYQNFFHEFSSS